MAIIRYRTEACSGSGVRDIYDVIKFELFELGNSDILITLASTYLKDDAGWIRDINSKISNGHISLAMQGYLVLRIIAKLCKRTGRNLKYALWLADYEVVMSDYCGYYDNIDAYYTSDIVLSELGRDGTLYAYEAQPNQNLS